MAESEDSNTPSTMDFQDLIDMAIASPEETQSTLNLTSVVGSTSVPCQNSGSRDIPINYNQGIIERIGSLIDSGALTDVKFIIGQEKVEIRAHKLILALSSPVFTSMFYSALESQDVIEIPDCRPDAFQALIEFIYKGEKFPTRMNVTQALSILYTARKYAIRGLEDICAVTLSSSICPENVFEILEAANLYTMSMLEAECWEFIENKPGVVLNCHTESLTHDVVYMILKNDRLNIREVELFEFTLKWAEHECKMQEMPPTMENVAKLSKKVMELIRFPLMNCNELADKVVPTGILSVDQIAKIFTYISSSPEKKEGILMEFSIKAREPRGSNNNDNSHESHTQIPPTTTFVAYEMDRVEIEVEPLNRTRSRRSSRRSRRRSRQQSQHQQ